MLAPNTDNDQHMFAGDYHHTSEAELFRITGSGF